MKTGAINFSVIANLQQLNASEFSPKYICPDKSEQDPSPPSGLSAWPAIFSFPKDPPVREHWANIISTIYDGGKILDKFAEPLALFDKLADCTYAVSKIEPQMYIVVIFPKKKEFDSSQREAFNQITQTFRMSRFFEILR